MFIEIIFVRSVREYTIESVHNIIGIEMRRKKKNLYDLTCETPTFPHFYFLHENCAKHKHRVK